MLIAFYKLREGVRCKRASSFGSLGTNTEDPVSRKDLPQRIGSVVSPLRTI